MNALYQTFFGMHGAPSQPAAPSTPAAPVASPYPFNKPIPYGQPGYPTLPVNNGSPPADSTGQAGQPSNTFNGWQHGTPGIQYPQFFGGVGQHGNGGIGSINSGSGNGQSSPFIPSPLSTHPAQTPDFSWLMAANQNQSQPSSSGASQYL